MGAQHRSGEEVQSRAAARLLPGVAEGAVDARAQLIGTLDLCGVGLAARRRRELERFGQVGPGVFEPAKRLPAHPSRLVEGSGLVVRLLRALPLYDQLTELSVGRAVRSRLGRGKRLLEARLGFGAGRSRQRQVVKPRQLAMYLCKELIPSLSLSDVGDAFGGKDHTTVLYACEKVAGEVKDSANARQTVEQLTKTIRS